MRIILPLISDLPHPEKVTEYQIVYRGSVPASSNPSENDNIILEESGHELTTAFISSSKSVFRLSDTVEYGSFFTERNQVILSYDYADELAKENHASLIGKEMNLCLYNVGNVSVTVVGIFKNWNENENIYIKGIELPTDYYYLNAEILSTAIADETFCMENGQREYILFFKNYKDAKSYLKQNLEWFTDNGYHIDFSSSLTLSSNYEIFVYMCSILLPLTILVSLFAVIFYTTTIHTELAYNHSFLSVFDYLGFFYKKTRNCFVAVQLKRLGVNIATAIGFSILFSLLFNIVNHYVVIIPFQVFTYNPFILIGLILLLTLSSFISTEVALCKLGRNNWYENLTEERDLL